jgi:uncharacterized protein YegP (UPF0339 family)
VANDPHFEVYPQRRLNSPVKTGEWGWRFQGRNGRLQAVGGEGFVTQANAMRAIEDFKAEFLGSLGIGSVPESPPIMVVDQ